MDCIAQFTNFIPYISLKDKKLDFNFNNITSGGALFPHLGDSLLL
jgi:hypothetical protein